jgi:hypothetical protein
LEAGARNKTLEPPLRRGRAEVCGSLDCSTLDSRSRFWRRWRLREAGIAAGETMGQRDE